MAEVQKKLGGVTTEAVRQRRARLQRLVPMPNNIALYVLAHQLELPMHRWVKDADTLRQVADYARQANGRTDAGGRQVPTRERRPRGAQPVPEVRLDNVDVPSGLLDPKHIREAERMSKEVYPLLYVFENSVREFIDGHLTAVYGNDWWDDPALVLVSKPVRDAVAVARKAEDENRYHSGRRARPVYYTLLGHLANIVASQDGWKVFKPPRFPRATWFPELIQGAEVSRNIVAHMNPIEPRDVRALRMSVDNWFKQIAGDLPPTVP
jgi:hypothetical protein